MNTQLMVWRSGPLCVRSPGKVPRQLLPAPWKPRVRLHHTDIRILRRVRLRRGHSRPERRMRAQMSSCIVWHIVLSSLRFGGGSPCTHALNARGFVGRGCRSIGRSGSSAKVFDALCYRMAWLRSSQKPRTSPFVPGNLPGRRAQGESLWLELQNNRGSFGPDLHFLVAQPGLLLVPVGPIGRGQILCAACLLRHQVQCTTRMMRVRQFSRCVLRLGSLDAALAKYRSRGQCCIVVEHSGVSRVVFLMTSSSPLCSCLGHSP